MAESGDTTLYALSAGNFIYKCYGSACTGKPSWKKTEKLSDIVTQLYALPENEVIGGLKDGNVVQFSGSLVDLYKNNRNSPGPPAKKE